MYKLRFDNENTPPILVDDAKLDPITRKPMPVEVNGYIIGSTQDPHWKPYPKREYPGIRWRLPISFAITDYIWDSNHYALYMPGEDSLSKNYSKQLRDHFERIHGYALDYQKEQRAKEETEKARQAEELKQQMKERSKQLTDLIKETKNTLKDIEKEFSTYQNAASRHVRLATRQGMSQEQAQQSFLMSLDPIKRSRVIQIEPTIIALKQNIKTMITELNELKKISN
tara:strand:- start:326 stop:1006 length:681 start_codon:yes stop_codon:yes gene_type:complete